MVVIVTGSLTLPSMVIVGLPPDTIVAHYDSNSGMTGATIAALIFVDFFHFAKYISLVFKSPNLEI